ncbi:ATP-dependent helicase [Heyndrickxia shackletonii]|uniref:ATP-dependent helicase n=1 Tax=Heyndrickxia shackletonii TaxID=157838 RepID=A0A0Q3TJL8_9BACI|nr:ATP-dependent DNA helicase [Heyndrickxia shackletonii]KQL53745.1 ATP-dependent helicase [Heyndrickxia shackletonii]NEY99891.1 ATP-dependent DNA helicase [Heyndrickxia shackletonii]
MKQPLPFLLSKTDSFYDRLGDWIGDVFYDLLPEKGYELRDEQIYMAFQLEKAFKEKKVIFAEAGVGTGKTIVYLLYALCYARYIGKPALIACADESLIEQLVKKEGDIKKIEAALDLEIDVRLAKSRDQYLCLQKLDQAILKNNSEGISSVFDSLPRFVQIQGSMQKFEKYGDRKDYPAITEDEWRSIAWDSLQDCLSCDVRHRCGQTLHREYYRDAADIIVCSHDFYMEHIWTKESRKREGQRPLLPEVSCVIFDEGHLLEYACQKALTYKFTSETLETLLNRLMSNDVREETLYMMENVLYESERMFDLIQKIAVKVPGSERYDIIKSQELMDCAMALYQQINQLTEQFVYESELYILNEYDLRIVEEYLEQILFSLKLLMEDQKGITWFEMSDNNHTLVIMPRLVEEILREEVFSKKIPFIFSSATLSNDGDFSYICKSLGISQYLSLSVDSPFDYDHQMRITVHSEEGYPNTLKWDEYLRSIKLANGRTLILFNSNESMQEFKKYIQPKMDNRYPLLFEGDGEISKLVEQFQKNEETVLCSYHLWEGLDIPGPSLSNVIINELPFPPHDPVFEAKRKNSDNPFNEVDLPYMLLRLRQGIGRLIRTSNDSGNIQLWLRKVDKDNIWDYIQQILPVDATFSN